MLILTNDPKVDSILTPEIMLGLRAFISSECSAQYRAELCSLSASYTVKMTQREYRDLFIDELDQRENDLRQYAQRVFAGHISTRDEEVIDLSTITFDELERLITANPSKMVQLLFRMTGASPRSVARDLRIRVGSEQKRIPIEIASKLAAYFKELLPREVSVAAVMFHDRIQRENELVRMYKGRWENYILALVAQTGRQFVKRRFRIGKKTIEIDGAYPRKGDPAIAIDVKRIEALEDYQKRTDEINAKALEMKSTYRVVFMACIFFPFTDRKDMVLNRLDRKVIDHVYFQDEISKMIADIQAI
jgi:hypothetical protein